MLGNFWSGVNDILLDNKGRLWIATAGNDVFYWEDDRIQPLKNLPNLSKNASFEQLIKEGDFIWLITNQEGIYRVNTKNLSVLFFGLETGLPTNNITTVAEGNDHYLFGSHSSLIIKNINDDGFKTHSLENDETDVRGIFKVKNREEYLVVSDQHLYRFLNNRLSLMAQFDFSSDKGSSINRVSISDEGDELFFSTSGGFIRYNLNEKTLVKSKPRIQVETITFDTLQVGTRNLNKLKIRKAKTSVEITYSALTFKNEKQNTYQYYLEGVDTDWSKPTNNRSVRYANLKDGSYSFNVRVYSNDGMVSDVATAKFTLLTPYWKSPYAITIYVFILLTLFSYGIHLRFLHVKKILQNKNEQRQFEAIQRLGAGLAHDMKNTLFSLNLLAGNLEKRFENPIFRKDAIETIQACYDHLTKLTKKLQEKQEIEKLDL